jgi:hypothetical protein
MRKKRSAAPTVAPVVEVLPLASSSEPMLLDIHGAARALSSTVWSVRQLLWDKQIPYIKIGRRFLIDPADMRSWIQKQKQAA